MSQGDDQQLNKVFVATMGVGEQEQVVTIKSDKAQRIFNEEYQQRYLLLTDGVRHQGRPGQADYRVTSFEQMGQKIQQNELSALKNRRINATPTQDLPSLNRPEAQAALQWRISAPVLILVITFLGIAMSYTTPRRGRYVMLFPSILLYLVYLVSLNSVRGAIEDDGLSATTGLWLVHGLFFLLALSFFLLRTGQLRCWLSKPKLGNV